MKNRKRPRTWAAKILFTEASVYDWISRLERKYGRFCIPNLISIIVGGQILVYAIELFVNQFISVYLGLSRSLLLMGQVWRLITFVFIRFRGAGR